MELKQLITHFTYRIEPKPEGGFIAHASDPAVPPLEAPTREELQQKIQANIAACMRATFPGLRLPPEDQELKFAFHIEHKPGSGFTIHSADPNAKPIEGRTQQALESQFAEKLISFVGKHFMPELSEALAAQGKPVDIQVFVNRKTGLAVNAGSDNLGMGIAQELPAAVSTNPYSTGTRKDAEFGEPKTTNASFDSIGGAIGNFPITPEPSSSWAILRFLLALLIIGAIMYFLVHRH